MSDKILFFEVESGGGIIDHFIDDVDVISTLEDYMDYGGVGDRFSVEIVEMDREDYEQAGQYVPPEKDSNLEDKQ